MNDTEKDRPPRKKDWKREYERGKEPGRYNDDTMSGSCFQDIRSPKEVNAFLVHNE